MNCAMIFTFLFLQRKQIDSKLDTEAGTKKRKKEIIWRANFEEFVRCLRNKVGVFQELLCPSR